MESVIKSAIQSAENAEIAFCKFLSANDTKSTKAHQSGYLISKSAWQMFFESEPVKGTNIKINITIKWQNDFETSSVFTYYGAAKDEFRITGFGRAFPFREERYTGDLFVLCRVDKQYYEAYILSSDEETEEFFAALNISAIDTNAIIPKHPEQTSENKLTKCFHSYLSNLKIDFPTSSELALNARNCYNSAYSITDRTIKSNPDREILNWLNAEFLLFKIIENNRYEKTIQKPFKSVEELVETANTILNRRKSRAGKSLEHHLAEIFQTFKINFEKQTITEDYKKPDFIFPNIKSYNNLSYRSDSLFMLAANTTCKDRWRQILNEADRIKIKHLFTLQQGISKNQLDEMYKYGVCLVVPHPYLASYPIEFRERILTLNKFIQIILTKQI